MTGGLVAYLSVDHTYKGNGTVWDVTIAPQNGVRGSSFRRLSIKCPITDPPPFAEAARLAGLKPNVKWQQTRPDGLGWKTLPFHPSTRSGNQWGRKATASKPAAKKATPTRKGN